MHPIVACNREALSDLCRRFHVKRLELFGSAAREPSGREPRDLDFLVEFEPLPLGHRARAYFGLLAALEDLFHKPVDFVMTRAIENERFLAAVADERAVVRTA
jgi:predicted nucleotidyltransferase